MSLSSKNKLKNQIFQFSCRSLYKNYIGVGFIQIKKLRLHNYSIFYPFLRAITLLKCVYKVISYFSMLYVISKIYPNRLRPGLHFADPVNLHPIAWYDIVPIFYLLEEEPSVTTNNFMCLYTFAENLVM